jgi:hypothetical protein
MDSDNKNGKTSRLLFYAFLLVYAGVMLYLSQVLNIWMDEAYTLDTTSAKYSLSGVIHQSYFFESQPPAYFIILWLWRKINDTVFFARVFSLINIGLAAWYFYKILIKITTQQLTKWMLVIFLLNPFVVFIGLEIRLYAFLIFLSAAAIYHYLKYFEENSRQHLFIFLGICLLGMYMQYFFAFLITALLLATLVYGGWKKAFYTGLYIIPVVLLFLPNVFVMKDQLGMVQTLKFELSVPQRISAVLHSPQNLLLSLGNLIAPQWIRHVILLVFAGLLLYTYSVAYKKNKTSPTAFFKTINFLLLTAIAAIVMMAAFITVTGIDHVDRYFTIIMPILILSYCLVSIYNYKTTIFLFSAYTVYLAVIFIYNYGSPVKEYDYKKVAAYIKSKENSNEPLLFYHSTLALPFRYYYKGNNRTVPVPHEVPFDNTYMANVKDTAELQQCIESNRMGSPSFLLISDLTEKQYQNNSNRIMVNNFLNTKYTLAFDTLYFGASKNRPLRIRRYFFK